MPDPLTLGALSSAFGGGGSPLGGGAAPSSDTLSAADQATAAKGGLLGSASLLSGGPSSATGAPVTINVPFIGGGQKAPIYLNGVYGTPENGGKGISPNYRPPMNAVVPANYNGSYSSYDSGEAALYQEAGLIDLQFGGTRGSTIDATALAIAGGVVLLGYVVLKRYGVV